MDEIVWEVDAATFRFTFVSLQVERVLGYPIEKWLGDPGFCVNHIHPDDRDRWTRSRTHRAAVVVEGCLQPAPKDLINDTLAASRCPLS